MTSRGARILGNEVLSASILLRSRQQATLCRQVLASGAQPMHNVVGFPTHVAVLFKQVFRVFSGLAISNQYILHRQAALDDGLALATADPNDFDYGCNTPRRRLTLPARPYQSKSPES